MLNYEHGAVAQCSIFIPGCRPKREDKYSGGSKEGGHEEEVLQLPITPSFQFLILITYKKLMEFRIVAVHSAKSR